MTSVPKISVFYDGRDRVGESPLWDAGSASLWWADIEGMALRCKHVASGQLTSFDLGVMPGALALDGNGSVIVVAGERGFAQPRLRRTPARQPAAAGS